MYSMEEEYKKTGIKPEDIAALRQWVKTQPHLPEQYITDLDLLLAYFCCYRSAEVAKQVLDLNLTLRTLFTNLFCNRSVDETVLKTLNVVLSVPLETPSIEKNYTVVYHTLIDHDAKNFNFAEIFKTLLMLLDIMQYENGTCPGYILLIDMTGVSMAHITKLDIHIIQQLMYFVQEAILLKLKGVHLMNAPSYVDRLMMLLRPFLKKELSNMIQIHSVGSDSIEKIIPIDALPKEAGGKFKSFEETKNLGIQKVLEYKDFFVEENKKRVVESLRPGKPKTITDIFGGVEGSFKKLDID